MTLTFVETLFKVMSTIASHSLFNIWKAVVLEIEAWLQSTTIGNGL